MMMSGRTAWACLQLSQMGQVSPDEAEKEPCKSQKEILMKLLYELSCKIVSFFLS